MRQVGFGKYVDTRNIRAIPSIGNLSDYRYALIVPFKDRESNGPTAVVIMKNPSMAGHRCGEKVLSDHTINRVCGYIYRLQDMYARAVILNLAGRYGTHLANVRHTSFSELVDPPKRNGRNDRVITLVLDSLVGTPHEIIAAWGQKNEVKGSKSDYDGRITNISDLFTRLLGTNVVKQVGGAKDGYPTHGATWKRKDQLQEYSL